MQGEGKEIERVFKHISCRIEAEEAEGVQFYPVALLHHFLTCYVNLLSLVGGC